MSRLLVPGLPRVARGSAKVAARPWPSLGVFHRDRAILAPIIGMLPRPAEPTSWGAVKALYE